MERVSLNCYFNTEDSDKAKDLGLGESIDNYRVQEVKVFKNKIDFYYEDTFHDYDCTMVMIGQGELCVACTITEFENLIK